MPRGEAKERGHGVRGEGEDEGEGEVEGVVRVRVRVVKTPSNRSGLTLEQASRGSSMSGSSPVLQH